MADDPLNTFRQRLAPRPASPALVVNRPGERLPYEAFAAKDKLQRLDIRCRHGGLAHAVAYSYLLNISYNRKDYNEIFITVSGLTVMVKGRGLQPVVDALRMNLCEFIQEFDPEEFAPPADPNAPLVESIVVEVMRGLAPSTAGTSKPA